ncbi:MAG: hypothetical protein ACYC7E_10250 [Armatimonadota bacterium]
MEQLHGMGMIATIEEGVTRLRPLEFSLVDGELWTAIPRDAGQYAARCDGQHVEVLYFDGELEDVRLHGVLKCSTQADDRQRLRTLEGSIGIKTGKAEDPDYLILKIIPEDMELT